MSIQLSPDSSPNMPSSSPVSIGWPSSSSPSSSSASSSFSSTSSKSSSTWTSSSSYNNLSCAFPSWPSRHNLSPTLMPQDKAVKSQSYGYHSMASAYISDLDLFPEDLDDDELPYLEEAPAPPREYKMPVAMPLLPLYPSQRPYGEKKRKSSSKSKSRPMGKPMSPILEAPLAGC